MSDRYNYQVQNRNLFTKTRNVLYFSDIRLLLDDWKGSSWNGSFRLMESCRKDMSGGN